MLYVWMALFAAGIVAADQFTKYLTVNTIPLRGSVPAVDGLFHFTYVQNPGAAFSSFTGMQWLFLLVFCLFTGFFLWALITKKLGFSLFEKWCLTAIWAGGAGNMIDRLRFSYVVDMIEVEFIRFPVFNVADCFVTCGCIALLVHLLFCNKGFWKDEKQ